MEAIPADWSTQQLTEFSSFVSGFVDQAAAARAAVERASEALEAEVGALVIDGRVGPVVGFPSGHVPDGDLLAVARGASTGISVPGVGSCLAVAVPLEDGIDGHIVLARSGGDPFSQEETTLLRGMARMAALSLNRIRVLHALKVSEERARSVIETAGESFVAVDLEGNIRDWNRQAEATFGWSAGEVVGQPAWMLFAPGSEPDAESLWKALSTSGDGEPVRLETWAQHRAGHRFPVEISAWAFGGEGGRSFNAFVKDITGRKRARELESRLAGIVQHSDDAIVGLSPDVIITSWNPGAERLYGYTAEEAIGRTPAFLTPWMPADFRAPFLLDVARGIPVHDYETQVQAKGGPRITVSVNASPIMDESGAVVGISSVGRDITERKRAERELAAARDQALEAARLKSEFLANMSHEIRTPMNAVIGMTQILLETDLSDEQREYATTVRTSGKAMLEIIDDILDFSKLEAGKMRLATVELTVQSVVEEVAEMLAPRAHEKGLEVTTLVDPALAGVMRGDPGRLRQVLLNLVGNAVKFTERGEIAIRATLESTDAAEAGEAVAGLEVRFEVVDTGIGIPSAEAERLFDPFFQVDASASRRHGGTGLGLAISSRLVETMGGRIGVRSEPAAGSCFWFTAVLGRGSAGVDAPMPQLGGFRALVVDDSAAARQTLVHQLVAWGAQADAAADVAAALDALAEGAALAKPYDVVLIDAQMDGLDGLGLVRALGDAPSLGSTRIVLLTPPGSRLDVGAVAGLRVAATLPKPVRQSSLLACLAELAGVRIERRRLDPPPGVRSSPPREGPPVLVAEDNRVNQRVAALMLRRLGYSAEVVGNGHEVLAALAHHSYSAVLMDCQMPGMDGYHATLELRRRESAAPGGSRLPVIAMTAGAMEGDRERALAAGMDDYISKPVTLEDLETVLERWTGSNAPRSDGASVQPAEAPGH